MPPVSTTITVLPALGRLDPLTVASGPVIPAADRVRLFSASDWEAFINEWTTSLDIYNRVERLSGAGDQGRDLIAFPGDDDTIWDNFQCKHYDHPLRPGDIWLELGKLSYFTWIGAFSLPRAYRFVAPRDVGTSLANLLRKPNELKSQLLDAWDAKCKPHISSTNEVPLSQELRAHIQNIDFGIFGYTPLLTILEDHRETPYYVARFGLGLPVRPISPLPPPQVAEHEIRYVEQLFEAYSDNLGRTTDAYATLTPRHQRHFNRSRESFYAAEALRNFSRDTLPEGTFEHLQGQVHDGVIDTCEAEHACGLTRLNATTDRATSLAITSSPLIGKTDIADLHGICHQLANEDRLTWVPEDADVS